MSFKQVELERGNLQPGKAEADGHDLLPETETRDGAGEYHLRKIVISTFVASAPRYILSYASYLAP